MIWKLSGNKWLDKHIRALCKFHTELYSCACESSPLPTSSIRKIDKLLVEINEILNDISKK